ncbi:hypothetical protein JOF29_003521 [Kribbella aluminosa]|uniref:Uncharacterized protein n=1 Tax=Kribbella aluminosa TaxID=416017 RepID=A0ABS4ULC1_9ACTN|nr:hypothetical protein [Kribbella aluminosa]MBP2352438.1 hypothetical protein [Kribbella aluminosa]
MLERLLTTDAISYSDGNGARQVSKFPVCIVTVSPDGINEVMWQLNGEKLTAVA